jgi:cation:H+ antiporter
MRSQKKLRIERLKAPLIQAESKAIMFSMLSLPFLLLIFIVAAIAIWIAGVQLSNTADVLSSRLGLGEALGGLILLAIATNLPEMAITVSAALQHNLGIATGNILGGVAIQTVVLVLLDVFGIRGRKPLMYRAASLTLVLEGLMVIAVLIVAVMATQLPKTLIFARISPGALLIAILWMVGLWLIGRARKGLPWHEQGDAPDAQPSDRGSSQQSNADQSKGKSLTRTWIVFLIASIVTLTAGVGLEESGDAISNHVGMSGVLFGATVLAAATALPEVSTGLASVKLEDYQLAVSDIFGGNAFLPVLFLLATLISGETVLPGAEKTDIYIAGLGILLTVVYLYGLIFRPQKRIFRMGIDSLIVLLLYVLGMVGLVAVTRS